MKEVENQRHKAAEEKSSALVSLARSWIDRARRYMDLSSGGVIWSGLDERERVQWDMGL